MSKCKCGCVESDHSKNKKYESMLSCTKCDCFDYEEKRTIRIYNKKFELASETMNIITIKDSDIEEIDSWNDKEIMLCMIENISSRNPKALDALMKALSHPDICVQFGKDSGDLGMYSVGFEVVKK